MCFPLIQLSFPAQAVTGPRWDRKLLIKAGALYFIPILGGIAAAFGLTALAGQLMGYGWREAILFVSLPIMGGSMPLMKSEMSLVVSSGNTPRYMMTAAPKMATKEPPPR